MTRRASGILGRVQRLWRYSVKSMLGEQRNHLDFDWRGVVGDRALAVRTADGKLGSGKDTRRFRRIDGLLAFRATCDDTMVRVHFPDGEVTRADDPKIHGALSDKLGRPVTLATQIDVSHLDNGPVHIVTSASLAQLADALPGSHIDERRFRPNVVLEVPDDSAPESAWIGRLIRIGNGVTLRIVSPSKRCGMVALAQGELPADPQIFRHIAERHDLQFGVYAEVVAPGRARAGDAAVLLE